MLGARKPGGVRGGEPEGGFEGKPGVFPVLGGCEPGGVRGGEPGGEPVDDSVDEYGGESGGRSGGFGAVPEPSGGFPGGLSGGSKVKFAAKSSSSDII